MSDSKQGEQKEPLEPIPKTDEVLGFPLGDIPLAKAISAFAVLSELKDTQDFWPILSSLHDEGETAPWLRSWAKRDLCKLSDTWGEALGSNPERGKLLARFSFFATVSMISDVLPVVHKDFDEELDNLTVAPIPAIRSMTNEAWKTMWQSHKNVHNVVAPFCSILMNRMPVRSNDEILLVRATSVLPYLLSSNAALLNHPNHLPSDTDTYNE